MFFVITTKFADYRLEKVCAKVDEVNNKILISETLNPKK